MLTFPCWLDLGFRHLVQYPRRAAVNARQKIAEALIDADLYREADLLLPIARKLMDIRLVKERAFSHYEVTRSKAVIQRECRMHDPLWHFEHESA